MFKQVRLFRPALPLLLLVFITACGGNGFETPGGGSVAVSASIGPAGGQVVSGDGLLRLDIPAGALTTMELITITRLSQAEMDPQIAALNAEVAYRLEPDGLTFMMPITATYDFGMPDVNAAGVVETSLIVPVVVSNGMLDTLDEMENVINVATDSHLGSGELLHFSEVAAFRTKTIDQGVNFRVQYPPTLAAGQTGTITGTISKSASAGGTTGRINWSAESTIGLTTSIDNTEVFSAMGLLPAVQQTLVNMATIDCTLFELGLLDVLFLFTIDSLHPALIASVDPFKVEIENMPVTCTGVPPTGGNLPYTTPQLFSIPQLSAIEGIRLSKDALPCANPFSAVVAGQGGAAQVDLATGTVTDIFSAGGSGLTFDALTFPTINPGDDAGLLLSGQGIEMKRIDAGCNPGPFSQVNSGTHRDATYNSQLPSDGAHIAGPGVIKKVVYQPLSQGWEFQDTFIPLTQIPSGLQSVQANAAGDKILAAGSFELVLIDGNGPSATGTSAFGLGSNPRRMRWDPTSGVGAISDFSDDTITIFNWDGQNLPVMTDVVTVGDGPVGIDVKGNHIACAGFNDDSYTIIAVDATGQATAVNTSPSPFTTGGTAPGHIIFLGDPNNTVIISFNGDGTIGVIPNAY